MAARLPPATRCLDAPDGCAGFAGANAAGKIAAFPGRPAMSFILQVFHAPRALTVQEADAAMDALDGASFGDRARFTRFVTALTAVYPNSDDEDAAFPEGLTTDPLDDAVYVFAVNLDRLDENLMAHVATCASDEGLHVLDPQNGLLYRS